jgi:hypothetical protein
VTQCVLDLTLIVSVHASFDYLQIAKDEDFTRKYQQIIDPLKCTTNDDPLRLKATIQNQFEPDISLFYRSIKTNRTNIRHAQGK